MLAGVEIRSGGLTDSEYVAQPTSDTVVGPLHAKKPGRSHESSLTRVGDSPILLIFWIRM